MWFAEILFQIFQIFHKILPNLEKFRGGSNFENHADPEKRINNNNNSQKSRENCWNLLEAFLRLRKEKHLHCHCDMNNA